MDEALMPRKPRVFVPGGVYHVILRGNGRQDIFFSDLDRRRWMRLLARGIQRYRCRIHAYCWMTNHIHMAVQVSDLPLGLFVGWAASQYAKSINKYLGRNGHLFERRYRGKLVTDDEYLLQLIRYIHLNPVVAHIVDSPEKYPWSSHRAYLGYRQESWLTTDWVLSVFGTNKRQATDAYQTFMGEEVNAEIAHCSGSSKYGRVMIVDEFAKTVHRQEGACTAKPSLTQIIDEHCNRYNVREDQLASPRRTRRHAMIRAEIAIMAQQLGVATLHDVSSRFNRTDSALCHSIKRVLDSRRRG